MNNLLSKLLFLFLLITMVNMTAFSQQKFANAPQPAKRCATDEAIAERYRTDPQFRAMMEQRERSFQLWKQLNPNPTGAPSPLALTGPVTIPVVVHVVLPNPNVILESDVDYFINRLNLDFSGLNPDSTNGVPFYGVRGHSLLRFCLARRDPSGNFTNGIERRVGAGTIGNGEPQAIKSFASGGLNPWNTSLYYNIWVGVGGGLLGIAPEIGPGTSASDGVCINYQGFANNPCYTIGAFNLGRTGIHEIGHNFGLYHTFQGACANNDNGQLTTASCVLPGTILSLPDQTPALSGATAGCPTGAAASGCASSPNPPGKQYQNYMDYTDDACYSMFTNTQVERMHWVTENCRSGYLTSNGCQLPAGLPALDGALIETVSPGGSELVGCTLVTYDITGCVGTFAPKVRVQNRGTTTLTSVTVQLTFNGTPLAAQTLAVNIPYGKSQVVTLNNATLIAGNNTLSFAITAVNGGADGNAANNTFASTYTFNPPAASALPFAQDFVPATFPPANMTVVNPNANNTWVRNANGNVSAGSAFIDNYNFNIVGQVDELRTKLLTIPAGLDSLVLTFDLAHKNFPGLNDRLQVLISSDCGTTFTATGTNPVFDRSGAVLATAGSSTANYTTPAAGDWKNQRIAIFVGAGSPYASGGSMLIAFKMTNGYSNNIFLDNINCNPKTNRDLRVTAIARPLANECTTTVTPQVSVNNNGAETVTSYKVAYMVDNTPEVVSAVISTPLAPGATVVHTLASFTTTSGSHTFKAYPKDPVSVSGSGEQFISNDTMSMPFTVAVPVGTATPASQSVCTGNAMTTIVLSSTVVGTTYSWTRTNTTNVTGIPASGTTDISGTLVNTTGVPQTVTITITPTVGTCSGANVTATIIVNPLPTVTITAQGPTALTPGQTVNLVATGTPSGGSYVWLKNGVQVATTATISGLTVDNLGVYQVRYTDPNGCINTSSPTELTAAPSPGIFVFPNPNNGVFFVRFYNTLSAPATLNVFDARGAKVFTQTYDLSLPYTRMQVNLQSANPGTYTVELMQKSGKRINTKHIVIVR